MIDYVGSEHRYQYMLIAQAAIMSIVMSMILYSSSFILADPTFTCKNGLECTEIIYCAENPGVTHLNYPEGSIDWKYNSWSKQYDLICANQSSRGFYKQVIMFMSAILNFIGSSVSDNWGRVFVFKLFSFFILVISISAYFVSSIEYKVWAMAIFAAEEGILCTVFTYIINESCTTSSVLRSKAIAFYFSIFALGGVILSGLTLIVDDSDTLYLIMVTACIVCCIPIEWVCFEPPKQLYKRGKISELFKTLSKISIRNKTNRSMGDIQRKAGIEGVDMDIAECSLETKTTFKEKTISLTWNFKLVFTQHLYKLFGLWLLASSIFIIFNGVTYNSGEIGLQTVQVNVCFLAGVEATC